MHYSYILLALVKIPSDVVDCLKRHTHTKTSVAPKLRLGSARIWHELLAKKLGLAQLSSAWLVSFSQELRNEKLAKTSLF